MNRILSASSKQERVLLERKRIFQKRFADVLESRLYNSRESLDIMQRFGVYPATTLDLIRLISKCLFFMSNEPRKKAIKVGVHEGDGPPPGYRWNVDVLEPACQEASGILTKDQYDHLARQVRELARQDDPTHSETIDVRSVEDFHEIRDKNGILSNMNVRVFFFVQKATRTIFVLGTLKKENNGPTPIGDKIRIRQRKRRYLETSNPKS